MKSIEIGPCLAGAIARWLQEYAKKASDETDKNHALKIAGWLIEEGEKIDALQRRM